MASRNDVTGDRLISRPSDETYRNNYDLIFGKKKEQPPTPPEVKPEDKDATPS